MKSLPKLVHTIFRICWRIMMPITVGVRVILLNEGQVLLVEHTYSSGWYLPGGGVKKLETLEEAIRREADEEIGAILGDLSLLGVYTNLIEHKSDHIAVFVCKDFILTGKTDREIKTFGFYSANELPEGASPGTRRRILEHINNSNKLEVGKW